MLAKERVFFGKLLDMVNYLPCIELTDKDIARAIRFTDKLSEAKSKEGVHKKDPSQRQKRFINGDLGEIAVEKWLGKKFRDTSVGQSKKYAGADLKSLGANCGIKTSEWGKCPLVPKEPKTSELIVILAKPSPKRASNVKKVAVICGVADVETLKTHCDVRLVHTRTARDRKKGFYGLDKLVHVKNLTDIVKVAGDG